MSMLDTFTGRRTPPKNGVPEFIKNGKGDVRHFAPARDLDVAKLEADIRALSPQGPKQANPLDPLVGELMKNGVLAAGSAANDVLLSELEKVLAEGAALKDQIVAHCESRKAEDEIIARSVAEYHAKIIRFAECFHNATAPTTTTAEQQSEAPADETPPEAA